MRSVPFAIEWCVCITIRPAGDIYSPTRAHTRAPCMKGHVTGRTIRRRLNVGVRACWRSSIRARMKVNNSSCQNPLSSKAKQVQYQSIAMNVDFSLPWRATVAAWQNWFLRMSFSNTPLFCSGRCKLAWNLPHGWAAKASACPCLKQQQSVIRRLLMKEGQSCHTTNLVKPPAAHSSARQQSQRQQRWPHRSQARLRPPIHAGRFVRLHPS
jgi:hypothetical protein